MLPILSIAPLETLKVGTIEDNFALRGTIILNVSESNNVIPICPGIVKVINCAFLS